MQRFAVGLMSTRNVWRGLGGSGVILLIGTALLLQRPAWSQAADAQPEANPVANAAGGKDNGMPEAAGVWQTFPLKYVAVDHPDDPVLGIAHQWISMKPPTDVWLDRLPKESRGKRFYGAGRMDGKYVGVLLEQTVPPVIYLDRDRDNDLSNETKVIGSQIRTRRGEKGATVYRFGPITMVNAKEKQGEESQWYVETYASNRIRLYPARYRTGVIKLGERSCRFAAVDNDGTGRYDDNFVFPPDDAPNRWDSIAVDMNGNGTIEIPGKDDIELQPLTKIIRVRDAYWLIKMTADGSSVQIAPAKPKLGTLDVAAPDVEMIIMSDVGVFRLRGSEGKWQVPVGWYLCRHLTMRLKDIRSPQGWPLTSCGEKGQLGEFKIAEGATTRIPLGPPLTLDKPPTTPEGYRVSRFQSYASVVLTDQAGVEYAAMADLDGWIIMPQSILVVDPSGRPLKTVFNSARMTESIRPVDVPVPSMRWPDQ